MEPGTQQTSAGVGAGRRDGQVQIEAVEQAVLAWSRLSFVPGTHHPSWVRQVQPGLVLELPGPRGRGWVRVQQPGDWLEE